eukprot:2144117-Prymnesium_polylepis.1
MSSLCAVCWVAGVACVGRFGVCDCASVCWVCLRSCPRVCWAECVSVCVARAALVSRASALCLRARVLSASVRVPPGAFAFGRLFD